MYSKCKFSNMEILFLALSGVILFLKIFPGHKPFFHQLQIFLFQLYSKRRIAPVYKLSNLL